MNLSDLLQTQYCISTNLRKACRTVTQFYADTLKPTGLQKTQAMLLMAVSMMGQSTITELAEVLVMHQTTVTRGIQRLHKRGLVESTPGTDPRTRVITLTSQGEAVLADALPLWEQAQTQMIEGLGADKAKQLLDLLSEIAAVAQER